MNSSLLRMTFGAAFVFNIGAAGVMAFPNSSLGQLAGLPPDVPVMYRALVAYLVGTFGCAYAWLAVQTTLNRELMAFGALGKGGAFTLSVAMWVAAFVSVQTVILAIGDLAFAVYWVWFLLRSPEDTDS